MSLTTVEEVTGREDDVTRYLHEIRQYPRLTREQEKRLARRCAEGDGEAIRIMVNSNLRLVVSIAREYADRGVPVMDLIQEGSIGLLDAVRGFDHSLDYRFSTYATKWIRQGVLRCFAQRGLIRVPQYTADKIRRVRIAKEQLEKRNGEEPSRDELAAYLRISPERLEQLLALDPEIESLDRTVGEDDKPYFGMLEDELAPQPYEEVVREELSQRINALLSMLSPRQQQVLRMRYGMDNDVCMTFEEIAGHLGISKERVRQLERAAVERLKRSGAGMGLEDFL